MDDIVFFGEPKQFNFQKVYISKNIFYIGYSKQVKMKDNLRFRTGSTKVIHWFRQSTENEWQIYTWVIEQLIART